jgi:hypothetical protein
VAAAAVSAPVAALTEGVIKAVLFAKLKGVLVLLLVAALACAAGLIYQTRAADKAGTEKQSTAGKDERPRADRPAPEADPPDALAALEALHVQFERDGSGLVVSASRRAPTSSSSSCPEPAPPRSFPSPSSRATKPPRTEPRGRLAPGQGEGPRPCGCGPDGSFRR